MTQAAHGKLKPTNRNEKWSLRCINIKIIALYNRKCFCGCIKMAQFQTVQRDVSF